MNKAIKLGRYSSQSSIFSSSSTSGIFSLNCRKGAASVRLLQVAGVNHPKQTNFHMDKRMNSSDQKDNNNFRSMMDETFDLKYATRCDDEGFGGTCGSNEERNGTVMEESFDLKYATRCDDEGFGDTYGSKEERNTIHN